MIILPDQCRVRIFAWVLPTFLNLAQEWSDLQSKLRPFTKEEQGLRHLDKMYAVRSQDPMGKCFYNPNICLSTLMVKKNYTWEIPERAIRETGHGAESCV